MKRVESILTDLTGLGGVGLLSYGAWLAYAPAGYMVGGALLLTGAVLLSRRQGG